MDMKTRLPGEPLIKQCRNNRSIKPRRESIDYEALSPRPRSPSWPRKNSKRWAKLCIKLLTVGAVLHLISLLWSSDLGWLSRALGNCDHPNVDGTFGVHTPKRFVGMKQIETLDESLIPGGRYDPRGERRLVFVGDIHGCRKQLDLLLEQVGFDASRDHLITTGDTVGKGPYSSRVVDRLIELNASSVRGNWEDRLLLLADTVSTSSESDNSAEPQTSPRASARKEHKLLKHLKSQHLTFLRSLPVILEIPALTPPKKSASRSSRGSSSDFSAQQHHQQPTFELDRDLGKMLDPIYVVHGGLVPGQAPEKQDPYSVMNMRSLTEETRVPSADRRRGAPWYRIWNEFQARIATGHRDEGVDDIALTEEDGKEKQEKSLLHQDARRGAVSPTRRQERPFYAVYGHDAKTGRKIGKFSRGLDSACVAGGRLTALVLDAWGRQGQSSVSCADVGHNRSAKKNKKNKANKKNNLNENSGRGIDGENEKMVFRDDDEDEEGDTAGMY